MAVFPTATQLFNKFLTKFESLINQDSPLNDKAFLRIESKNQAITGTLLQKEVVIAQRENLAITASRAGLILIGAEYDLPIKTAVSTVLNVTLPATTGTQIPAGTNFTGDDNGILYFNADIATSAAGVVTFQITSRTPGTIGNLADAKTLTISIQIPGAELTATVVTTETTGADAEETEVYRQRVLDIIRAPGGGGNSADFRNWAQEQEGVTRAYPYSGVAFGDPLFPGGSPPDRTVYIEADTSIDVDGIAPQSLLDDTKLTIITDPDTLVHRQPLGLTNDTLFVVSIRRTDIFTEIRNALFLSGTESQVKTDINTALNNYYLGLNPFVEGLDIDADRNDLITDLTVSRTVQDILTANGASAEGVAFGLLPASFIPSFQLGQGEKVKNAGVSYVTT